MDEDFEVLSRTDIPSVDETSHVDLQVLLVEYEDGSEGLILYEISMGNHLVEEKLKKRTKETEMVFLRHVFSVLSNLFMAESNNDYMYDVWKSMEEYYLEVFNEHNNSNFGELLFLDVCDNAAHYSNVHINREDNEIELITSHGVENCDIPFDIDDMEDMARKITNQYKGYTGVRIAKVNDFEKIEEEEEIDEEQDI